MNQNHKINTALFQVYLRLRPPQSSNQSCPSLDRILTVEETTTNALPMQVILSPPSDNRRRAVEKFSFTRIFKEDSNQLDVFHGIGLLPLIEGTLGKSGGEGRDGLLATLGVTGSGKTHTILGSRSQRGLIQLALDVLFQSISKNILHLTTDKSIHDTVTAADPSEAQIMPAQKIIDTLAGETVASIRAALRSQTPAIGELNSNATPKRIQTRTSMPRLPDISNVTVSCDINAEYVILISIYEVYNDRIYDLLAPAIPTKYGKEIRRRPLLYKHTELSPHRKVVAGLRKVLCATAEEALMVLKAGLHERQVAGTGSNSVSSRSHCFFSVEIKKRRKGITEQWGSSFLTIVDLAGSERARDAKTQGSTLAEAGKINESLMYLGQCLQVQSHLSNNTKSNIVPFRQCKLTELLFSNFFLNPNNNNNNNNSNGSLLGYRNPQKAIMIVMADPLGDFNATSQILRYSALAREVTVPRVPSVSSTILAQFAPSHQSSAVFGRGRSIASESERETMEIAALEISRMSDEIDGLRAELRYELERKSEIEAYADALSNRIIEVEAEVREECFQEMEQRMEIEMRRWKANWALEAELKDEHLDRKLDIYTRSIKNENLDKEDKENTNLRVSEDLETENMCLRGEVEKLRRKIQGLSPSKTKRLPLRENKTIVSPISLNETKPIMSPEFYPSQNSQTHQQFQKQLKPLAKLIWEPSKIDGQL